MTADSYVFRVVHLVRQQLLELPPDERRVVIQSLQAELTGKYGDQTTQIDAWHLPRKYWVMMLSCGKLAVYREMGTSEVDSWESYHHRRLTVPGYMVMYLLVDVDPSGAL